MLRKARGAAERQLSQLSVQHCCCCGGGGGSSGGAASACRECGGPCGSCHPRDSGLCAVGWAEGCRWRRRRRPLQQHLLERERCGEGGRPQRLLQCRGVKGVFGQKALVHGGGGGRGRRGGACQASAPGRCSCCKGERQQYRILRTDFRAWEQRGGCGQAPARPPPQGGAPAARGTGGSGSEIISCAWVSGSGHDAEFLPRGFQGVGGMRRGWRGGACPATPRVVLLLQGGRVMDSNMVPYMWF